MTKRHPKAQFGPEPSHERVLVRQYLTAADLIDQVPDEEYVSRQLSRVPVERALDWCARMLAPRAGPDWRPHQEREARAWFSTTAAHAEGLRLVLAGERELLAPQVVLHLARLALLHGCPLPPREHETQQTLWRLEARMRDAMLVLAHHSGWRRRLADEMLRGPDGVLPLGGPQVTRLEGELAANLIINHRPYAASVFDRSERRWVEIPQEEQGQPGAVDLLAEFEAATGVPLSDLRMIGLVLWSCVMGGTPRTASGYLDGLGLGPERTQRALALISGTAAELADKARSAAGPALSSEYVLSLIGERAAVRLATPGPALNSEYDLSLFGERPVVRLANGGLLILEPHLLIERTMGWLPRWDLINGLRAIGSSGRRRAGQADAYLRATTERHAVETLQHLAATGKPLGVLYGEEEIQRAFGTAEPNADCALDWPGVWVVVEISSRTVTRETATASAEGLVKDLLLGVVEKAEQLDGTIRALRADERTLTGRPRSGRRRFWPVLVTTEGFPLHPLIVQRAQAMIRDAGHLQDSDTEPIVILDVEALEAAEALAERGSPALPKLLRDHASSDMRDYGFREWLILKRGGRRAPERVMQRWARVLDPALDALLANDPKATSDEGRTWAERDAGA